MQQSREHIFKEPPILRDLGLESGGNKNNMSKTYSLPRPLYLLRPGTILDYS